MDAVCQSVPESLKFSAVPLTSGSSRDGSRTFFSTSAISYFGNLSHPPFLRFQGSPTDVNLSEVLSVVCSLMSSIDCMTSLLRACVTRTCLAPSSAMNLRRYRQMRPSSCIQLRR
ncbi:hypothetical protein T07_3396 [Trichinella nelsoni]|uniref:Uncharacterized protein n=1 Tax=Trichinella nelsoni TaxID=6336 RepID=A0A0V0RUK3_9BILA|nr:hypothetical protein T07_3396 [Trichinella nelsoni]